jgi:uracil-DNA glycosylase
MQNPIDNSWNEVLKKDSSQALYTQLLHTLKEARNTPKVTIYPQQKDVFKALRETPLKSVKVVILGQDPYHGAGQADGLCFSVPQGIPAPPSLSNIFKEIESDTGIIRTNTDLTNWAQQGVLLLNSVLTVEAHSPASHSTLGWQDFTDEIIRVVSSTQEHVVFLLWGSYAQSKTSLIDSNKHLILTAPHPSPLSAYRGFLGCKHFSKVNAYLKDHDKAPITW